MGCCKSKVSSFFQKDNKIEFADKRTQINRLYNILDKIDEEILKLKQTQMTINQSLKSNADSFTHFKKRSCFLSQMIIFVKWSIKVVEVNQEDKKIDYIIDKANELVIDEDEFKLISLENKIKHLINKNNK